MGFTDTEILGKFQLEDDLLYTNINNTNGTFFSNKILSKIMIT